MPGVWRGRRGRTQGPPVPPQRRSSRSLLSDSWHAQRMGTERLIRPGELRHRWRGGRVRGRPGETQSFPVPLLPAVRALAPCAAGAAALLGHCPDAASQTLFPPSCIFCFVSEMPVKCLSNTLFKSGENEAFAIYISLGSLKSGWICAAHMVYLTALLETLGREGSEIPQI